MKENLDPYGPLYFDPDSLIYSIWIKRLNNLWVEGKEEVGIGFILSCSGLQSMIIFVGAIVALQTVPWNRIGYGISYGLSYTAFVLAGAVAVFQRRDIK